jgi:hypothetical protein
MQGNRPAKTNLYIVWMRPEYEEINGHVGGTFKNSKGKSKKEKGKGVPFALCLFTFAFLLSPSTPT